MLHYYMMYVICLRVQGGVSPLHTASEEGHADVVDTLLRKGADPNLTTTVWGLVFQFHNLPSTPCALFYLFEMEHVLQESPVLAGL